MNISDDSLQNVPGTANQGETVDSSNQSASCGCCSCGTCQCAECQCCGCANCGCSA